MHIMQMLDLDKNMFFCLLNGFLDDQMSEMTILVKEFTNNCYICNHHHLIHEILAAIQYLKLP
jgi:hypothetical protein